MDITYLELSALTPLSTYRESPNGSRENGAQSMHSIDRGVSAILSSVPRSTIWIDEPTPVVDRIDELEVFFCQFHRCRR